MSTKPAREPLISDHAILRYLERVKGLDMATVCEEMLSEGRHKMIAAVPNCKLPVGGGQFLVVVDGRIVTVAPRDKRR